jgi:myo-inositol-1(or 4)-monophosphatase
MLNEVTVLLAAMRAAGKEILALQQQGLSVEKKANNDIVTIADLAANDILRAALNQHFPDDGWLSEESVDDPARLACERVWVVDPIDGTREFASGIPEYAVSVALVEKGEPIVAAVFNPATNELFHAVKGQGAWLGEQRLYCQASPTPDCLLLASRSEYKRGEWTAFQASHRVEQVGSIAYKLALVAAGRACGTFSLGPKSEWDVAAGVLLVSEAQGIVTNQRRNTLQFNQKNVIIDGIVATAAAANEAIFSLIKQ